MLVAVSLRSPASDSFNCTRETPCPLALRAVGLGCFVGPIVLNHFVPPRQAALRWGVAASYALFAAGFAIMLVAPHILLVLVSTFVRSMGGWWVNGWPPLLWPGWLLKSGECCSRLKPWRSHLPAWPPCLAGSATLWVYSTLLMQQRVPNEMLGRMSGEEVMLIVALWTCCCHC